LPQFLLGLIRGSRRALRATCRAATTTDFVAAAKGSGL
jgi:hypothetical protein